LLGGFEDRTLAENYAERLDDFLQLFIVDNTQQHLIDGYIWKVHSPHIVSPITPALMTSTKEEAIQSSQIIIIPTNNFDDILKQMLLTFGIVYRKS